MFKTLYLLAYFIMFVHTCSPSNRSIAQKPIDFMNEKEIFSNSINFFDQFIIDSFQAPWSSTITEETNFMAFTNGEWFEFEFNVIDSNIVQVDNVMSENDVARGDRVEIFFSGDTTLANYYCIEINPSGEVLDYNAKFYRQFDEGWDLDKLQVSSHINDSGYVVKGKIPISFLDSIQLGADDDYIDLLIGVYRANYNELDEDPNNVQWITWISPETSFPDFHVKESFSKLKIRKK